MNTCPGGRGPWLTVGWGCEMGVAGWTCLHMGGVATGDAAGRAVPAVPPSELGSAADVLAVGRVSLLAASDSVEEGPLTHAAENTDWKEGND